jgi:hypothetical protein
MRVPGDACTLMQCTGAPVARNGHAKVFHGRNIDIGLIVENITAQVWRTRSSVTIQSDSDDHICTAPM